MHDGPYAETKEFLGGIVIIDVPNLDAALEWAARNPAAADVFVEVRPLADSYFAVRIGTGTRLLEKEEAELLAKDLRLANRLASEPNSSQVLHNNLWKGG